MYCWMQGGARRHVLAGSEVEGEDGSEVEGEDGEVAVDGGNVGCTGQAGPRSGASSGSQSRGGECSSIVNSGGREEKVGEGGEKPMAG